MASFGYNPICDYVSLTFRCDNCGEETEVSVVPPMPDLAGENHRESQVCDSETILCDHCGKEFEVDMSSGICGGDGYIAYLKDEDLLAVEDGFNQVDDDFDWEEIPEDVYEEYTAPQVADIKKALEEVDKVDEPVRAMLYRNLYANVISCLEAYLSDTAIKKIMGNPDYKRRFVESSEMFKKTNFPLSSFYEVQSTLDAKIEGRLREIIYHKLDVVGHIYKDAFNIKFGDIKPLMDAVAVRHDIVHRNGKTKEGNENLITKQSVLEVIKLVSDFITNIQTQFIYLELP